ncbi:RNA polymerase-binding protein RbpA [Mycetocola reblochoni]|uniref:RNA polymerase-binding protein RbpA n=2 Tax=Mycetocola reblochoni TaxID=331618 RepID=A0A1R4J4Y4_9MICO|nr:RNA polymerase-binding protein RbpA [Mycetocola reblochoni]RLP69550.1 RNA polymerase-binding protein RbpA [Mycetocola reblochoni]SJN27108.1 putative electron transport protein [Mycetocola reblochoni REB411]
MVAGGSAIRGSRVGAGPMGEQDHGFHAERRAITYWDALGNATVRYFAANVADEDIPEVIDCPKSGLPAGQDKDNPPAVAKPEPYKTHLAYVKERRTEEEAAELLEQALQQLRERRGTAATAARRR